MRPALLSAQGLGKRYGRRQVVQDASFEVRASEVVGLLGPNGAGKTTCFRMVVGLASADAGRVTLSSESSFDTLAEPVRSPVEGQATQDERGSRKPLALSSPRSGRIEGPSVVDLTRLPMHRRCRLGLGYLPQEASIFRGLTVRENFLAILELAGVPKAEREERVRELLVDFNLERVRDSRGDSLSGGERRRAEIARSLIPGPSFILFDEPFAGVDPLAVGEIQELIGSLRERGLGVLISDHNARETLAICDRAYLIAEGRILEEGTPAQMAQSPRARSVYLGESFRLN